MKLAAPSALIAAVLGAAALATPAAAAERASSPATFATINGSGSSWAGLAIDLWAQDLRPKGLMANYNPDGSAAGRGDYGARLPDLKIMPVVQSQGAGTTYFFTRWMAHVFARPWNAFCLSVTRGRVKPPCGPTEFYPTHGPGWHPKPEDGSNNVATYLAASQSNGAIGYDQYAYAANAKLPVLKLRNPAGRFVAPTPVAVTTALTRAVIDENRRSPNFGQENLDALYTYRNPNSYPLAYYGYWIVPRAGTKLPTTFTRAKGRSLSTMLDFALCAGQRQVAALAYGRLPRNLVAGGLRAVGHIPGHVRVPTLASCMGGGH